MRGMWTVDVEFQITLASGAAIPRDASLFIAGSFGGERRWAADAAPCLNVGGTWRVRISLEAGVPFEFKFTQGSWDRVETDAVGNEIPNRVFTPSWDKTTCSCTVQGWKRATERSRAKSGRQIRYDIFSKALGEERTFIVRLPLAYEKSSGKRWPVLYCHDGQHLFGTERSLSGGEWRADIVAAELEREGLIPPVILVALFTGARRVDEFLPIFEPRRSAGGKSDQYCEFVAREVKPRVEAEWDAASDPRAVGTIGSSFGGLAAIDLCRRYPGIFGHCGALSPGLWPGNYWILDRIAEDPAFLRGVKLWFDMGSDEGIEVPDLADGIEVMRRLEQILLSHRFRPGRDYYYQEIHGGLHHEQAWSDRLGTILRFFLQDV